MEKKKILITDQVHPILIEKLVEAEYDVEFKPGFQYKKLASVIGEYAGIIINSKIKMTPQLMDLANQLQFIGRLGSGLDIIDLEYAKEKDIDVISTPEGNRNAVSEHALGMLLSLANNLHRSDQQVRNKIWKREENRGFEIKDKVIGIVGLGNTGRSFAEKLSCWAHRILFYDKYLLESPKGMSNIERVRLEYLQEYSDIISLHLPLTHETEHFVDNNFINKCKPGFVLINTSRGKVVDTNAIIQGMKTRLIGGLCLDVFENEKPDLYDENERVIYDTLFDFENAVFTPHVAGWSNESLEQIALVMAEKIIHRNY